MSKNDNIAIEVIRQEIAKAKESFEFWAVEANGDEKSLASSIAQDSLTKHITLKILLEKITEKL